MKNLGDKKISAITLMDDFSASDFEAVEPATEFHLTEQNNASDSRLFWIKLVRDITPNETRTLQYEIKYIGSAGVYKMELKECTATVNGSIVGMSNSVFIDKIISVDAHAKKETQELNIDEVEESEEIDWVIIAAGIALVLVVIIFLNRMKTAK